MDREINRLSRLFLKFPGIGERQARRFAHFILTQPDHYVRELAESLRTARAQAHTCSRCQRVYEGAPGLCSICADTARDGRVIAVVEKSQDIDAFARTDYGGVFFVLGGLIPIVQKNIIGATNASLLVERVRAETTDTTSLELILAFPLTPNGEHTDAAIRELLAPLASERLLITSLGRGLSTGAELEYADAASLSASLKKRE